MSARAYLTATALASLLLALLVLGVNFWVDPYGLTGTDRIDGLNRYKVDINNHARLLKKYQHAHGTYNALILGNSRVEMGIDPSHRCFATAAMEAYNLGLPGAPLGTQFAYAMNVIHQQQIEHLFIGIDFSDFIRDRLEQQARGVALRNQTEGALKYLPAGGENPAFRREWLLDHYRALFSLDALKSSIRTVAMQREHAPDRDGRGFNPARDFSAMVRVEGPGALFEQKMHELEAGYARDLYIRDANGQPGAVFHDLEEFLDLVTGRGITTVIFINPAHQDYWELLRRHDHMALYAQWQDEVRELASRYRDRGVAFWDFSQDSPYLRESVPATGLKAGPLRWFWEPVHYRRELGDLMVEAMLAPWCDTTPVFGRQLF